MKLRPALISSFTIHGTLRALQEWPGDVACELYCFMNADIRWLIDGGSRFRDAVEAMASWSDNDKVTAAIADRIHREFEAKKVPIVGFASYLPEMSDWREDKRESAIRALRFLIRLASTLRGLGRPELKTIEIVAGRRVQGLFRARVKGQPGMQVCVNKVSRLYCFEILAGQLAKIEGDIRGRGLSLAIEMEPGPLNVCQSARSATECARVLLDSEYLSKIAVQGALMRGDILSQEIAAISSHVGFNIDIAHYGIIEGVDPKCLDDKLLGKVFHAHISDHAPLAHLGDLPLDDSSPQVPILKAWIEMLNASAVQEKLPVEFSGCLSLEQESARDIRTLRQSVEKLKEWLN